MNQLLCVWIFLLLIGGGMNLYHKALYCLHFQRDIDRHKIDSSKTGSEVDSSLPHWTDYFDCAAPYKEVPVTTQPQPRQTMQYIAFNIQTRITRFVSKPILVFMFCSKKSNITIIHCFPIFRKIAIDVVLH